MSNQELNTKIVTGKVRFSYCHVWEPSAMDENSKPKFSVAVIIPKKNVKLVEKIKKCISNAEKKGINTLGGKIPKKYKNPTLRDGDEDRPDDENYKDCWFINASSVRRPQIVDENRDPIIDEEEFYSGCFGRVSINFYAYNANGNKGIAAGLNNLQKLEDGERLSGGSTAEEDFGEDFDDDDDFFA